MMYNYNVFRNIIYDNQFGFREKHSSYTSLIALIDHLSKALKRSEAVIGLFLDFSKTFDAIDHELLLVKLYHYGVRGEMLNYIISLTEHNLYHMMPVNCGVLPGSILGPLLFLTHVYMLIAYLMLQLIYHLYFMLMTPICGLWQRYG